MEFVKSGVMVDGFLEKEIHAAIIPACREFERAIYPGLTFEKALEHYMKALDMYKVLIENPPVPEIKIHKPIQFNLYLGILIGTASFMQSLILYFAVDNPRREEETKKLVKIFLETALKTKPFIVKQSDQAEYRHICKVMGVTPP